VTRIVFLAPQEVVREICAMREVLAEVLEVTIGVLDALEPIRTRSGRARKPRDEFTAIGVGERNLWVIRNNHHACDGPTQSPPRGGASGYTVTGVRHDPAVVRQAGSGRFR
jgi:hypothetical protein